MYKFACRLGITGLAQATAVACQTGARLRHGICDMSVLEVFGWTRKITAVTVKHVITRHGAF